MNRTRGILHLYRKYGLTEAIFTLGDRKSLGLPFRDHLPDSLQQERKLECLSNPKMCTILEIKTFTSLYVTTTNYHSAT